MKNRKLILIVSLVLAMTMSLGGTLAYLQDSDKDVNVMTLGSVTITQNEHQRAKGADGNYKIEEIDDVDSYVLEVYQNDKPLLPTTEVDKDGKPFNWGAGDWDPAATVRMTQIGSYGSMSVFTSKNAQDKFVTVTNTGKTDAYVRTYVAFEAGSAASDKDSYENLVRSSYHSTWEKKFVDFVSIEDNIYAVYEYNYKGAGDVRHGNGILPAGDTTYPSLAQVYLTAAATNEDMDKLDGNGNGKLDILVLSQAIQADGFTNAEAALNAGFPKGTDEKAAIAKWFGETEVGTPGDKWPNNDVPSDEIKVIKSAADLTTAVAAGENALLADDITLDNPLPIDGGVIDGNNKVIYANSGSAAYESGVCVHEGTLQNVTVSGAFRALGVGGSGDHKMTGDAYYKNVTTEGSTYGFNIGVGNGNKLFVDNCTIGDWNSYSGLSGAEFTNCTFISDGYYYASQRISAGATFTYTNCEFKQNTYNNEAGNDNYYLNSYSGTGTIVLDNCTMNGVKVTEENLNTLFQIEDVTVVVN